MTIYIAFLRGINVGGKNRIKMADLKSMFEAMGLWRVETYIQSGNIIFETEEKEEDLRIKIEQELKNNFSIVTNVILRSAQELEVLLRECPFTAEEIERAQALNTEGESFYVNLMEDNLPRESLEKLQRYQSETDEFRTNNRNMYLLLQHSIRNSKLAGSLQRLDMPGTVRNWNCLNKIMEVVKARS